MCIAELSIQRDARCPAWLARSARVRGGALWLEPRTPWPLPLASHFLQVAVKAQATAAANSGKQLAAGQRKAEGAALKALRRTHAHAQQLAALREETGAAKREAMARVRAESAKAAKKGCIDASVSVCVYTYVCVR